MVDVKVSGPLLEGRVDPRKAARTAIERGIEAGAEILRGELRLRTRYSTPKYGRAAASVQTRLVGTGEQTIGRAFIGGQAAFLAPWLEFGTTAHFIAPRSRRRGGRAARALAIRYGGAPVFRAFAHHPGTRAYGIFSKTQDRLNRVAPEIMRQALAEAGIAS